MAYPFTNPSPTAQSARRKIKKVHSSAQRDALDAVLSLVEELEERIDSTNEWLEEQQRRETE